MSDYPSIFNNVIGPIMRGPSSSHTAASVRIGLLGRMLLQDIPKRAIITFDPEGSLATTYRGQGSAMGLAGGLLEMQISDPDLINAEQICRERGIEILFRIEPLAGDHPNTYHIELTGTQGKKVQFVALSTGGGIIRLVELDGGIIEDDSSYVQSLYPIQPQGNRDLPFVTIAEMEQLLLEKGGRLSDYALSYESALGGVEEKIVADLAAEHLRVMREAVSGGLEGTSYQDRILPAQSHLIGEAENRKELIPSALINDVIASVSAVMETKSSMGVIVAAPTAGSCGTLPGALSAVAEKTGKTGEEMERAVLAAGLLGVFIAREGGFAAEEGGCQYECGAASGMTAAALVELMGGDGATALKAASMALQNTLGLICDPVADRVEVPCLGKNIMAALNAVAAANMALAGFAHVIPLGQVICAMKEVGAAMCHRFRCTCKGGLSITPAAQDIHAGLGGTA
ncbi:L-serine ammonia-lyase, iron-sulfur-dependent, subunit alpha [Desulfopila inferna]|uniref:L-serine ammonia-lyase, iron-sulfur-dependent, subunit alpha n=1 Tax=Desulfopila inferna TaxID=468528 RepID=UPI0019633B9C|nr:L-serine ammonia-lyase, iron-sulfur-dependent, subunit alpha [Desulfopila inferna]MBM9604823.1 L-serine ammonia-lyase, iron-sulfur-dependent, subunit alpha [Desulfopila inferna]